MTRFLIAAALLVGAGVGGAADNQAARITPNNAVPDNAATDNAAIANSVRHAIVMYPRYSIFDDVYIQVEDKTVHLTGVVDRPFKRSDIDKLVKRVQGADRVQDDIRVLPLSDNDIRLRLRIARAIYGDMSMTKYAMEPLKPIHIIVENGHITLTGIVATDFDKQIAGTRAATAGMSFGPIVNNLQVENPAKKS
jgi:hyperosmotically inducible protein